MTRRFKDPRQRERHLRIFEAKLHHFETPYLKRLVHKLWDQWTWDTGDQLEKDKIKLVEEELTLRRELSTTKGEYKLMRQLRNKSAIRLLEFWRTGRKGNSPRKQRKRERNKMNRRY